MSKTTTTTREASSFERNRNAWLVSFFECGLAFFYESGKKARFYLGIEKVHVHMYLLLILQYWMMVKNWKCVSVP